MYLGLHLISVSPICSGQSTTLSLISAVHSWDGVEAHAESNDAGMGTVCAHRHCRPTHYPQP